MKINTYTVVPSLPEPVKRLRDLAYNLRWSWDSETMALFQRLDRTLWNETYHNPVRMLGLISQGRLEEAAKDDGFRAHLDRVLERFDDYMNGPNWFSRTYGGPDVLSIAYLSFEFGISESLPTYSGGLGVLAGDHLKAASDLGLPLTGVSLLYRQGYFRQYLNPDGWQQEIFPENDFYNLPVTLLRDTDNTPLTIEVETADRKVRAQIWQMEVGRTRLLLLDTNIPVNSPADQEITAHLYGGDNDMRIRQEILMGIGGVRALAATGRRPDIYHMNEGHSAFLALERIRRLMEEEKVSFAVAREAVRASNVFTTHTPVPAGNDSFDPRLVEYYFRKYVDKLQIGMPEFLGLGRQNPSNGNEPFCMTVLALNLAAHCNGVSALHGKVSRKMWTNVWPGVMEEEIPIAAITNGVHTRAWISQEMATLFDRYLGPLWAENPADESVWARAEEIPDAELWRSHERRRERLVAFARQRLREQLQKRGAPEPEIARADEVLDPEVLTIGFARRFALYKRGTLLLRDRERITRLLTDRDRPIQIIFAGKAHPADTMAKEIIRELIHFMRDPAIRRRVVFIEDYDMNVARYLVQGVDVWLNTPRRPLEASGTSGMKAAANGALNVSVLDGWWCEGYSPDYGWAIGQGEQYDDLELQDAIESRALYDLLEKEVIPLFYQQSADRLPREWIQRMKASIHSLCSRFSANRMLHDYIRGPYMGAASAGVRLTADNLAGAKELAAWKERVASNWSQIQLAYLSAPVNPEVKVGERLPVEVTVRLGQIKPEEVLVQLYHGHLNNKDVIIGGETSNLRFARAVKDTHLFQGAIACKATGRYGFAVRVLPNHEGMTSPFDPKLIYWA